MFLNKLHLASWIHSIDPFLIRFPDGFFLEGVRWYGFAYFLSFLLVWLGLSIYAKRGQSPLNSDQQVTLITSLIFGVLIGGRLGYILFYDFSTLLQNPLSLFKISSEGIRGMSSHGGFIGVCLALAWFSRHTALPLFIVSDIIATLAPIGFLLGRIANFINSELWGRVTDVSWGVIFPQSAPFAQYPIEAIQPRHPSQLYEAGFEGFVLLIYMQYRFWNSKSRSPGQLSGEFLIGYSILRIAGEIFREPDASLLIGLTRGQFYSLFTLILGIIILLISKNPLSAHLASTSQGPLSNPVAKHPPLSRSSSSKP